MFREDFEFHDEAGPSHHGGHAPKPAVETSQPDQPDVAVNGAAKSSVEVVWLADAENELKKIPFFVRGKARRNTEAFASERGLEEISVDTLYEAKAHYAR
jgi:light-independent protochlorophyllide reductase subunit B